MKKIYVAPKSEYINFEQDDVLTATLPISDYTNTDGDSPDTETGVVSNPDAVSPFA